MGLEKEGKTSADMATEGQPAGSALTFISRCGDYRLYDSLLTKSLQFCLSI